MILLRFDIYKSQGIGQRTLQHVSAENHRSVTFQLRTAFRLIPTATSTQLFRFGKIQGRLWKQLQLFI